MTSHGAKVIVPGRRGPIVTYNTGPRPSRHEAYEDARAWARATYGPYQIWRIQMYVVEKGGDQPESPQLLLL